MESEQMSNIDEKQTEEQPRPAAAVAEPTKKPKRVAAGKKINGT